MPNPLEQFYRDSLTRDSVKDFLVKHLQEKALELVFGGQETQHLKLSKEVIEEAWNKLEQQYGEKKELNKENKAR